MTPLLAARIAPGLIAPSRIPVLSHSYTPLTARMASSKSARCPTAPNSHACILQGEHSSGLTDGMGPWATTSALDKGAIRSRDATIPSGRDGGTTICNSRDTNSEARNLPPSPAPSSTGSDKKHRSTRICDVILAPNGPAIARSPSPLDRFPSTCPLPCRAVPLLSLSSSSMFFNSETSSVCTKA